LTLLSVGFTLHIPCAFAQTATFLGPPSYTPKIYHGDTEDIIFTIYNGNPAETLFFLKISRDGIVIYAESAAQAWPCATGGTAQRQVTILNWAGPKTYGLTAELYSSPSQTLQDVTTFTVVVVKLFVSNWFAFSPDIPVGGTSSVTITFTNGGNDYMWNTIVSIADPSGMQVNPSSQALGDIPKGESRTTSFLVRAPETLSPGQYTLTFRIEYDDFKGGHHVETKPAPVKVVRGGPADLVVTQCWVIPANPKQEDAMTFYAIIANIGGSDANNFRLETYLDGSLYDSGSLSLRAGEQAQVYSEIPWRAEDGSHTVGWVVNPDRSIQESNYGNNEASCSFFVGPRTVTATVTVTKTSTRTQTQRTETTVTTTRTTTIIRTTQTTILETVTGKPAKVTQTATGLSTSTIYSPTITSVVKTVTVTVTVTMTGAAKIISNPILWVLLTTLAMMGAVVQLPANERLKRFASKFHAIFPLADRARRIIRCPARKAVFAVSLISLMVLSIQSYAAQQAYAGTVTVTKTATTTDYRTVTQTLTTTRYTTSTSADTSTVTRTYTRQTTVAPKVTTTVDRRSTTTTYVPTTTYTTTTTTSTTTTTVGPDIRITSLSTDKTAYRPGEPITVIMVLKNFGTASSNGKICYKLRAEYQSDWYPFNPRCREVGRINPGESKTITDSDYDPPIYGWHGGDGSLWIRARLEKVDDKAISKPDETSTSVSIQVDGIPTLQWVGEGMTYTITGLRVNEVRSYRIKIIISGFGVTEKATYVELSIRRLWGGLADWDEKVDVQLYHYGISSPGYEPIRFLVNKGWKNFEITIVHGLNDDKRVYSDNLPGIQSHRIKYTAGYGWKAPWDNSFCNFSTSYVQD